MRGGGSRSFPPVSVLSRVRPRGGVASARRGFGEAGVGQRSLLFLSSFHPLGAPPTGGVAPARGAVAAALTAAPRPRGPPRPARSAPAAAQSGRLAPGAPAPPAGLGMRLARLLQGGRGVRPRCAVPSASRSLASGSASGSGPESERGVPGQVDFYARFSPSPLSMKQFLDFGEGGGALCTGPRPPRRTPPPSCRLLCVLGASFLPGGCGRWQARHLTGA